MAGVCWVVLVCLTMIFVACAQGQRVPALFAFGDSLVDAGNNYVLSPPYGMDFFSGQASGRFCNGRLVVDFIASYLNLPFPPAYRMAGSNILKGVNFGSASAGVLPQTRMAGAKAMPTQINDFRAVQSALVQRLGSADAATLVSRSIFYICIANNDINNAFQSTRSVSQSTIQTVLSNFVGQIQTLYNLGARKFVIQNLSAVGCIPINQARGVCNTAAQSAAANYNSRLNSAVAGLRSSLQGSIIVVTNFFDLMVQVKNNPRAYGFSDSSTACCPMGQASMGCRRGAQICPDRTKYAFFDGIHQTEAFNELAASRWFSGGPADVSPMNINQLAAA